MMETSTTVHRREFLKTTLGAGAAAATIVRSAAGQTPASTALFPSFERRRVDTTGATINVLRGGSHRLTRGLDERPLIRAAGRLGGSWPLRNLLGNDLYASGRR